MPRKAMIWTRYGKIEVAPQLHLSAAIKEGLRRFGPLTSYELASWGYFGRNPTKTRLGQRWQANSAQWSAARRALARLRRRGVVRSAGWSGRARLYQLSVKFKSRRKAR